MRKGFLFAFFGFGRYFSAALTGCPKAKSRTPTAPAAATNTPTSNVPTGHVPTLTATSTASGTPTLTRTSTPTFTITATSTNTGTSTSTFSPTLSPTSTPSGTPTDTATVTPTFTPSDTPTVTDTFTITNTPTDTATMTSTGTPTSSPTPKTLTVTILNGTLGSYSGYYYTTSGFSNNTSNGTLSLTARVGDTVSIQSVAGLHPLYLYNSGAATCIFNGVNTTTMTNNYTFISSGTYYFHCGIHAQSCSVPYNHSCNSTSCTALAGSVVVSP